MSLPLIIKDIEDRFKISGGTLTGNVEINKSSYPTVMIKDLGQGRRGEFIYNINEEVIISNYKDENNRSLLFLRNENNVNNSLQLSRVVDGQWSNYNIYGEHNKPTASDVGALSLNGGTLTDLIKIHKPDFKYFGQIDGNNIDTYISHNRMSDGSMALLGVQCKDNQTELTPETLRLKFYNAPKNTWQDVKIYGEHYKPTIYTMAETYNSTTRNVDIRTFMDTPSNIHKTGEFGELNLYRFFCTPDESAYASYNYPCIDQHVMALSIDGTTNWTRLLTFDMRSSNIFTVTKSSGTWRNWDLLYGTMNITKGTASSPALAENFIYLQYV